MHTPDHFSGFGSTLDPLDTGRGTTVGTFSASVPSASGLRGTGLSSGGGGTSRGTFAPPTTLTLTPPAAPPRTGGTVATPPVKIPGSLAPLSTSALTSKLAAYAGREASAGGVSFRVRKVMGAYVLDMKTAGTWATVPVSAPGWRKAALAALAAFEGKAAAPRAVAPRGTGVPKTFKPSRATLPAGVRGTRATTPAADTSTPAADTSTPAADTGSGSGSGGGTMTVTSETTSAGYDVWGGGSSLPPEAAQAQALVDAAETPTELVTEDTMTVSEEAEAPAEEGFFAKYKWWLAGGVGAVGVYAYMHRMDPSKYPLPEAISKLVRK